LIVSSQSAHGVFLTIGWLRNWEDIFRLGLGWDEIDARQNMGSYDKILRLDNGVSEFQR
jgi:hypothetical protein